MAGIKSPIHHTLYPHSLADVILRRIRGAAHKERWGLRLMQLAWTAGPVTYLALQGGYMIGYGKSAPNQLFIYFAGYTLVAGLFALVMRFLYQITRGGEKDEDLESLQKVFDLLPERIIEVRDMQLGQLYPEGRCILGAKYLLENPDASPDAVRTAVLDLTENRDLADIMHDMEVYRRYGLRVRAGEKAEQAKLLLELFRDRLAEKSGDVARLVWFRAAGEGPSRRVGRRRTRGFLGRIIIAAESDNLNLMSLVDVEEVCMLTFELICGRRFPVFQTRYSGDKSYTEAAARLSRARRDYRTAVYVRNSRLRVLAERLYASSAEVGPRGRDRRTAGQGIRRVLALLPQIRSARAVQEKS